MSKNYWEKVKKNNCSTEHIIDNSCDGDTIVIGRQINDGLSADERLKLDEIESRAQVNIIENIEVNSEKQEILDNKTVNIFVPTKLSELINDKHFIDTITSEQVKAAIGGEVAFKSDYTITETQWADFNWDFKEEPEYPEIPSDENAYDEEGAN